MSSQKMADFFVFVQIILFLCFSVFDYSLFYYLLILCLPINMLIVGYLSKNKISIIDLILITLAFITLILFGINSSHQEIFKYTSFITSISAFFAAMIFRDQFSLKLLFYLNVFCNLAVLFLGFKAGFKPEFGNNILSLSSRNIVSGYLLLLIIYYLFLTYILNKKINVFLILLFVFNCFILYGRSGVALSCLLLLYSLYKRYGSKLILIMVSIILASIGYLYTIFLQYTNFSSGLDTPRSEMAIEYMTNLTTHDIFFGRDIEHCCSIILQYRNPHNTFLNGHIEFGIMHTIIISFIALVIIASRKTELIFLLLILYLRYAIDVIGLFSFTDIVLYAIFIYSYKLLFKGTIVPLTNYTNDYFIQERNDLRKV